MDDRLVSSIIQIFKEYNPSLEGAQELEVDFGRTENPLNPKLSKLWVIPSFNNSFPHILKKGNKLNMILKITK